MLPSRTMDTAADAVPEEDGLDPPAPAEPPLTQAKAAQSAPAAAVPAAKSLKRRSRRPRVGWGNLDLDLSRWMRNYFYGNLWMEHHLTHTGELTRQVVVESEELRCLLQQPRRRAIESLFTKQEGYELRTSELWEWAGVEALAWLQAIHANAQVTLAKQPEAKQQGRRAAPTLGRAVRPTAWTQEARGILLYADSQALYVWDAESLRLLKIRGPGLEAIQAAGVRPGQTVLVEPNGHQSLAIDEERSGTHGSGRRTLRRTRGLLKVHRLDPAPQIDSDSERPQWRRA